MGAGNKSGRDNPRKVRTGVRTFEGANYIVRRIKREMFFGFELTKYGDFWIPVSGLEKTLIDFVYFRQQLNIEVLMEVRKKVDWKTLNAYLKRCPSWVKTGVLDELAAAKRHELEKESEGGKRKTLSASHAK